VLPTFIGIGPGRAATSMIYEVLLQHAEISMARGTKETNYFSTEYHRGREWYENFFRYSLGAKAVGEISTSYFYHADVPERIWKTVPTVRLFTCLRNPFDRLRSVYLYRKRSNQIPAYVSLEKAVMDYPDLVTDNYYATYLNRYFAYFRDDQILVSLYDDLLMAPEVFVQKLLSFLGVHSEFDSRMTTKHINASAVPRSRWVGSVAAKTAKSLRQLGFFGVLDALKRSRLVRQLILTRISVDDRDYSLDLSQGTVRRLHQEWEPQINQLERLLGRSLQHWLKSNR
jgi:hypothetical protein